MLSNNLYHKILVEPIKMGADELNIVSGYATASMVSRHLEEITQINPKVRVKLIVGMAIKDGITISNHKGFLDIQTGERYKSNFSCQYIFQNSPVHSKVFIWKKENKFHTAFIGSANYSQTAFSDKQREMMEESKDEINLINYFEEADKDSMIISHSEIEQYIKLLSDQNYWRYQKAEIFESNDNIWGDVSDLESVTFSLLSKRMGNEVQNQAGLNWGQRPSRKNKNEAYLQLPPTIYKSNFFPKNPNQFLVTTDDNKTLIFSRVSRSKEGQNLITPLNNALLGEYFRNRIGVLSENPIWRKDLEKYGRTDVTFYKIDEETFFMDFSI